MTNKHTPGPWSGTINSKGTFCVQAEDANSKFDVAYCAPMNEDGPRKAAREFANGRLIAAAPDLLAALKGVASSYTSGSEVSHLPYLGTGTRGDIESKWRAVLAAIAKAEGR